MKRLMIAVALVGFGLMGARAGQLEDAATDAGKDFDAASLRRGMSATAQLNAMGDGAAPAVKADGSAQKKKAQAAEDGTKNLSVKGFPPPPGPNKSPVARAKGWVKKLAGKAKPWAEDRIEGTKETAKLLAWLAPTAGAAALGAFVGSLVGGPVGAAVGAGIAGAGTAFVTGVVALAYYFLKTWDQH